MFRARLTLLRGAASTRDAHTLRNAARASGRLSPSTGPTTGPHVTSPGHSRRGRATSQLGRWAEIARFALEKIVRLVAVLFAVSIVVFFLGRGVAPGDVGTVLIGTDGATPAQIDKV